MSLIIWIVFLSVHFVYDYIFKVCIKERRLLHPMKYLGDKNMRYGSKVQSLI